VGPKNTRSVPLASPQLFETAEPVCSRTVSNQTGSTAPPVSLRFHWSPLPSTRRSSTLDTIDLFLLSGKDDAKLRQLDQRPESGRKLRFQPIPTIRVLNSMPNRWFVPNGLQHSTYHRLYARGDGISNKRTTSGTKTPSNPAGGSRKILGFPELSGCELMAWAPA